MREEALSARVNSCPSQNLRGCELWVGGAGGDCGKGTTFSRAVRAPLSFCHSEELQFRGICFAASPDREQGFPRRLPPARDDERRSSIGTSKTRALPKICANVSSFSAAAARTLREGHAFMRAATI